MGNARGGSLTIHIKARMLDRLMADGALHGGVRSIVFGDGTLVAFDPPLRAEDLENALPEWLTGHPAVTSYPLKPQHAGYTQREAEGVTVHRLPGQHNQDSRGYDPVSLQPLRTRRLCQWGHDCGGPAAEYRMGIGDIVVLSWLCAEHAEIAATDARAHGGTCQRTETPIGYTRPNGLGEGPAIGGPREWSPFDRPGQGKR